jgi:hypothetical protein
MLGKDSIRAIGARAHAIRARERKQNFSAELCTQRALTAL